MHGQDLAARIIANPAAAGGGDFQSWLDLADDGLPGLRCEVTALGGNPDAYRIAMRWPLAGQEAGRMVIWIGR